VPRSPHKQGLSGLVYDLAASASAAGAAAKGNPKHFLLKMAQQNARDGILGPAMLKCRN
jgi:hypothetical protein